MKPTNEYHEQPMQAGAPKPPLSPHLMAVWGAFLHEGLMLNSNNGGRASAILELWGQGCVELITAICDYIPEIWRQVQPYWYGPQGFPGVFEYEVVSIIGEQLGTYILTHDGNLPSESEVQQIIADLVASFFSIGGPLKPSSESDAANEKLIRLHNRFLEYLEQAVGGES